MASPNFSRFICPTACSISPLDWLTGVSNNVSQTQLSKSLSFQSALLLPSPSHLVNSIWYSPSFSCWASWNHSLLLPFLIPFIKSCQLQNVSTILLPLISTANAPEHHRLWQHPDLSLPRHSCPPSTFNLFSKEQPKCDPFKIKDQGLGSSVD